MRGPAMPVQIAFHKAWHNTSCRRVITLALLRCTPKQMCHGMDDSVGIPGDQVLHNQ